MAKIQDTEEYFWSKVNFFGPTPEHVPGIGNCWVWMAGAKTARYGAFWLDGGTIGAHRAAWIIVNGSIPQSEPYVLHNCDNSRCVRPDHLRTGTPDDNMQDKVKRGRCRQQSGAQHWSYRMPERRTWGKRNGAYTHPERVMRGESHVAAKLTESDVREIRRRYPGATYRALAAEFGVTYSTVAEIVTRQIWKHLTP